ncbi:hypothetical protein ISS03_04165 [Patescibacteria group bacterium]|nr:hypothetical protein [Patescibacteria group bacterium]
MINKIIKFFKPKTNSKPTPKLVDLTVLTFLVIFCFQISSLLYLVTVPSITYGAETSIKLAVPIGDYEGGVVDGNTLANYIEAVYKYGISLTGILAAMVMMFGGLIWATAGGDAGKVTEAKAWITAAISGLVLAMSSFLILQTINPELVKMQKLDIKNLCENGQPCGTTLTTGIQQGCCASPRARKDFMGIEADCTAVSGTFNVGQTINTTGNCGTIYTKQCCQKMKVGKFTWSPGQELSICKEIEQSDACVEKPDGSGYYYKFRAKRPCKNIPRCTTIE